MDSAQQRRDRQDGVLGLEDRLDDPHSGQADRVVGGTLAFDHLVGRVDDVVRNGGKYFIGEDLAPADGPFADRDRPNGGTGPDREFTVPVLTDDGGMHAGHQHVCLPGHQQPQP